MVITKNDDFFQKFHQGLFKNPHGSQPSQPMSIVCSCQDVPMISMVISMGKTTNQVPGTRDPAEPFSVITENFGIKRRWKSMGVESKNDLHAGSQ